MKPILTILGLSLLMCVASCNNDNAETEDNTPDSIGNPSENPSSTSVLTDDSVTLKNADTMHKDSTVH